MTTLGLFWPQLNRARDDLREVGRKTTMQRGPNKGDPVRSLRLLRFCFATTLVLVGACSAETENEIAPHPDLHNDGPCAPKGCGSRKDVVESGRQDWSIANQVAGLTAATPSNTEDDVASYTDPNSPSIADASMNGVGVHDCDFEDLHPSLPMQPKQLPLPGDALSVVDYGARPGEDCRHAIQAALTQAAANGGGTVLIPPANQPYLLSRAGTNPFRGNGGYALRIPSDVTLFVASGALLQLAADQQSDTDGPVDLIVFDGENITITGGGTISGNTRNQPRWTGGEERQRFRQVAAGCLIRGYHPLQNVVVSDLFLQDAFSNPVNLEADTNITLQRLATSSVGEGVQVIHAQRVTISDIDHDDFADVSTGDGIEVSAVTDFVIQRSRVRASAGGAGSAIDAFGSSNGVIENITVHGWGIGIEIHDTFDKSAIASNVVARRLHLRTVGTGIVSTHDPLGHFSYENILIEDCSLGIQALSTGATPLRIANVRVAVRDRAYNYPLYGAYGLLLRGSRDVHVTCAEFMGGGAHGVVVDIDADLPPPHLQLRHVTVAGFSGFGLVVLGQEGVVEPDISIYGSRFEGNGRGAYAGLPASSTVQFTTPPTL